MPESLSEPIEEIVNRRREEFRKFVEKVPVGPVTDRSLSEYQELLDLPILELKDKTVLDIGSGKHETFAKEAAQKGANVISINPYLKFPGYREELLKGPDAWERFVARFRAKAKEPNGNRSSIAALGQDLPFKDEVFDIVTSVFAVPHYLTDESDVVRSFDEIARVLKPGGKAFLIMQKEEMRPLVERAARELTSRGLKTKITYDILKDIRKGPFYVKGREGERIVIEKPEKDGPTSRRT
ncbi:hypothetical protein A2797_01155 [candidate division WWE3 bacterium RIFCSPHIGHO2_01_FULL_48_15]|uniref:Methyltransferase type 11 domain-containing protein n=1 Tax=candidate division WWE3 bacterium RIFCSPHIGHO2_01_FULL_48_15 TaxID=1802619 RepID=A0A1F4VEN4_UNCKA|nr:MAG: hypothetical protein A2797_01155 [candidate division WWE3 bacterium RIFCSPHIGHO2_01_FULL_48_15]